MRFEQRQGSFISKVPYSKSRPNPYLEREHFLHGYMETVTYAKISIGTLTAVRPGVRWVKQPPHVMHTVRSNASVRRLKNTIYRMGRCADTVPTDWCFNLPHNNVAVQTATSISKAKCMMPMVNGTQVASTLSDSTCVVL